MSDKIFPRFQKLTDLVDLSSTDVETLNDEARMFLERELGETEAFLSAHPEYYQCDENAKLLEAWMYLHGDLPFTLWNLEIALRDLQEDGLLRQAPPPEQPVVDKTRGIKLVVTDALAEYQTPPAEQAALAKVADDLSLNDHQRKARLRKLALLAGQQRRSLQSENLYR
jgi:hypothetical protein